MASKCEGSDKIYRADIVSINPDRKKVRVHFVDYATVTIVPYSDIDCLPEAAKKFPIYGCMVELVSKTFFSTLILFNSLFLLG